MQKLKHLGPMLAIAAAAAGVVGLSPLAFGMAGMATPLFPFAGSMFLLVILGGPLLLLASGVYTAAARVSKPWFLVSFTVFLVIAGFALFWKVPAHGVLLDWTVMSIVIALIAASLRRSWLWALVGGTWTGALLGSVSVQTAIEFLSPAYHGTPGWWWPLWLIGCILALTTGIVAFMGRKGRWAARGV